MMTPTKYMQAVVIGAGLSGLAAARALHMRGVPVTILEASDRIAAPWRARHPQLRLNIHRHFARLPGMPMPSADGTFARRDTVVRYLEAYAGDLDADIEFGTRVERIDRTEQGWHVRSSKGNYLCDHLIVATGRDSRPHIPDWPGRNTFGGDFLYAADLGDITRFAGRDVLVIGAGNSGTDVLNHLAKIDTGRVWVSVRHGPAILPTRMLGFPLHRLARLFAMLPRQVLDPAFAATEWLAFGNLRRYGLRRHPDGGGTRLLRDGVAFAVDDGFVAALKQGRVSVLAETVGFTADAVELSDGHRIRPDAVICATGYRSGLEPLAGHLGVLDAAGQPRHAMGQADPDNPGLWFTGFTPGFTGYFDAAAVAARRIARGVATTPRREVGMVLGNSTTASAT